MLDPSLPRLASRVPRAGMAIPARVQALVALAGCLLLCVACVCLVRNLEEGLVFSGVEILIALAVLVVLLAPDLLFKGIEKHGIPVVNAIALLPATTIIAVLALPPWQVIDVYTIPLAVLAALAIHGITKLVLFHAWQRIISWNGQSVAAVDDTVVLAGIIHVVVHVVAIAAAAALVFSVLLVGTA